MRRYQFAQTLAEHIPAMRVAIRKHRFDHDTVSDLVQEVIAKALTDKQYQQTSNPRALLCKAMLYAAQHYKRELSQRGKYMMHIVDSEDLTRTYEDSESLETDEAKECPFCFAGPLNQYGACALCHTVLPDPARCPRQTWEEVYLLKQEVEYEKQTDVRRAIAQLTPLQQKLVKHVIQGNETLAEFAITEGVGTTAIWRELRKAQHELQAYLADYSVRRLVKHPLSDLQACLN